MDRLSDAAIEIVNELHRERLDYDSEYLSLIDALNRLASYEDLEEQGRLVELPEPTPDIDFMRIFNLVMADAEDRVIVLPCKVGDTVYLPGKNDWGDTLCFEVIEIGIDRNAPYFVIDDEECEHIPMKDIGKTVFLTREEAEARLKEEEHDETV